MWSGPARRHDRGTTPDSAREDRPWSGCTTVGHRDRPPRSTPSARPPPSRRWPGGTARWTSTTCCWAWSSSPAPARWSSPAPARTSRHCAGRWRGCVPTAARTSRRARSCGRPTAATRPDARHRAGAPPAGRRAAPPGRPGAPARPARRRERARTAPARPPRRRRRRPARPGRRREPGGRARRGRNGVARPAPTGPRSDRHLLAPRHPRPAPARAVRSGCGRCSATRAAGPSGTPTAWPSPWPRTGPSCSPDPTGPSCPRPCTTPPSGGRSRGTGTSRATRRRARCGSSTSSGSSSLRRSAHGGRPASRPVGARGRLAAGPPGAVRARPHPAAHLPARHPPGRGVTLRVGRGASGSLTARAPAAAPPHRPPTPGPRPARGCARRAWPPRC